MFGKCFQFFNFLFYAMASELNCRSQGMKIMKNKSIVLIGILLLFFVVGFQNNCDKNNVTSSTSKVKVTPVDSSLFIKENLLEKIVTEDWTSAR